MIGYNFFFTIPFVIFLCSDLHCLFRAHNLLAALLFRLPQFFSFTDRPVRHSASQLNTICLFSTTEKIRTTCSLVLKEELMEG